MPANLTQQFRSAESRYRNADTSAEKLDALQEMLREIPKHKGTDHMQADIKRKISQLKKEQGKKSATAKRGNEYHFPKEGAGQVIVVGPPNSGKSSLLDQLSNAKPEVADFPFTTRKPLPCMAPFQNVKIQLIDTPPISEDFFETWLAPIVRNSDLVVLLLDLASDNLLDDYETVLGRLEQHKLQFQKNPLERFGENGVAFKKTLVACNKSDDENAGDNLEMLEELIDGRFEVNIFSVLTGEGVDDWLASVYQALDVIRIYPKQSGKAPDKDNPVVLKRGATVMDFAHSIHKDFAHNMKFARIWGKDKYDGQMVNRDFVLSDEDTIEMRI